LSELLSGDMQVDKVARSHSHVKDSFWLDANEAVVNGLIASGGAAIGMLVESMTENYIVHKNTSLQILSALYLLD
jgi:hypothetical protein